MARNGAQFTAEAEKIMNRTIIFGFGKSQKFEDAADAFTKAGNAYKLTSEYSLAGQSFLRASDCQQKADSGSSDVVNAIVEAGNCFKMGNDLGKAADAYNQAIMSFEEKQRYGQCAKYQKEVAEMYEASGDFESAIQCFKQVRISAYIYRSIETNNI